MTPAIIIRSILKNLKKLNRNWKLLRGNNGLVHTLSNALNGKYKVINDDDVAHSNTVTVLNDKGQIQLQSSGTLTGIKPIIEYVERNYSH